MVETNLDGIEQRLRGLRVSLRDGPVDPGGGHERRGALERRDVGVGAVRKQQAHRGRIARQRRAQERRLPSHVHPRQVTGEAGPAIRPFARACVDVRAALDEQRDDVEQPRAIDRLVDEVAMAQVAIAVLDGGE